MRGFGSGEWFREIASAGSLEMGLMFDCWCREMEMKGISERQVKANGNPLDTNAGWHGRGHSRQLS